MRYLLGVKCEPNAILYFRDTVANKTDKFPQATHSSTRFNRSQLWLAGGKKQGSASNTPKLKNPALPLFSFDTMTHL